MSYGFYLSAAGAVVNMHRMNVLANNLANVNTVGFKPDRLDVRQRLPERLENPDQTIDPRRMLERLGGGIFADPTHVVLGQGDLVATGSDLDLAIAGDGFFVVAGEPGTGAAGKRLTRDGRFTMNAAGELTMAANGRRVLDNANRPIRIDSTTPLTIDRGGRLLQRGAVVAQIQLVDVIDSRDLVKEGANLLRLSDDADGRTQPFTGSVRQGHTEESGVDPITTMMGLMAAAKAAQGNLKMMQYHDQVLGRSFNTFGRVA